MGHLLIKGAESGEYVRNAEAFDFAGYAALSDDLAHGAAKAADDECVFNGDYLAGILCRLKNQLLVDGLEGISITPTSMPSALSCFAASTA